MNLCNFRLYVQDWFAMTYMGDKRYLNEEICEVVCEIYNSPPTICKRCMTKSPDLMIDILIKICKNIKVN